MVDPMNHDEVAELLGAFALDAVDDEEAAEISEHVATCPRCQDELTRHRQVAAVLGNVGGAAPEHLWDAIESAIEADGAKPPTPLPASTALASTHPLSPRPAPKRPVSRVAVAALTAAAVAAIAVLGVQVARLDNRVTQAQHAATSRSVSSAAENALLDPSARRIPLMSSQAGHPVVAEVVTTASGTGFMFNRALPKLASSRSYQLWALTAGKAISAGLLGTDPGTVAFTLNPEHPVQTFALSVEPAAGSVAPTSTPVAAGTA
jgi:anti-sigma factor RsiW